MSLSRKLLQIVEIDVEQCSHTYGTGGCSAVLGGTGERKCYNFLKGCQVPDDFAATTKTLRYAQNQAGLPKGVLVYPAMTGSVSTNPSKISIGGVSDKFAPIGKYGTVTAKFKDFTDSDIGLDPYQAQRKTGAALVSGIGFDPATRGTHFGRLRQRFPFYTGRAMRVKEGYVGQDLDDMVTKYYTITSWDGPDASGAVTVTASSILDFGTATAPRASNGRLRDDLGTGTETITITPEGIGDEEYPSSGYATIGSEIVRFVRGSDNFAIAERGLFGTDVSEHDADDVFQLALSYSEDTLPDIANDLCENYADVPAALLDKTEWDSEADTWMPSLRLTTVIPKPVKVSTLMSELCLHGVTFYEDEQTQLLKMSADRPANAGEELFDIVENRDIIENTIKVVDLPDSQVTRALFWYGMIDPTDSATDSNNYKSVAVSFNSDLESEDYYDQTKEFQVQSRWLLSQSTAVELGQRLVSRFGDIPKQITFEADVKDRDRLPMGKAVMVTSRVLQGEDGSNLPTGMQITSVEEIIAGHRLRVTGQSFDASVIYAIYMADDAPDFDDATDDDKTFGAWYADDDGLMSDGTKGNVYF